MSRFPFITTVLVLVSTLLLTTPSAAASQQSNPAGPVAIEQAVQAGCSFLTQLYNSTLHLVKETLASNAYHISSDNLLAQQALSYCNQSYRHSIQTSLKPYRNGTDMMHEALLGLPIPLPIHNATIYKLFNGITGPLWHNIQGNYTIDWEDHNSTGILQDTSYADVASYMALELNREGNPTGAMHEFGILSNMFDGTGMVDKTYTSGVPGERGVYQTFKAALYLKVLNTLFQPPPPTLVPKILQAQGADGGFHTGYNATGFAGTRENAETTSIVILALESFPPSLIVETSPWDGGYIGDSFFFYFTLTNNGTSWLNITSVTITLDYGIFKPPGPLGVVPPGRGGGGQGFSIPIPSTTTGNHTLTLTTSFQSYDNASSTWLTKSPIVQTATLIVKPFPELDNRPALLAATATATLGLVLGLQSFRSGKRLSDAVRRKPVSMGRTISLLLITVLAFYLLAFPSLDYRFVFLIFFPPAAIVVLLAVVAGEASFVRERYKLAILLPLVLLSLSATLASHVYVGVHGGGGQCYPGLLGAGFPLPWDAQTIPYLGPPLPVPSLCPALILTWWTLTPVYFLLDTALYAALGIGIIEAYRRIRQQHMQESSSHSLLTMSMGLSAQNAYMFARDNNANSGVP